VPERQVASDDRSQPPPSASLVLIRVFVTAFLKTQPRKRSEAFLDEAAAMLASEDRLTELFPIRPEADHAAVRQARREAVAMFKLNLPTFLASIEDE
jgi:hypothetical protein